MLSVFAAIFLQAFLQIIKDLMFCKVNYVNFTIGVESTQHFVEAMPFRTSPHKKFPICDVCEAGHVAISKFSIFPVGVGKSSFRKYGP